MAQPSGVGLGALQGPSSLLQDTNGDAVVDVVRGRIVLPDSARSAEATAAANLAARLGFETAAADLEPILRTEAVNPPVERPLVLVGRAARLAPSDTSQGERLAPGQGRVAVVPSSEQFSEGALQVVGADASGLLAAADYVAGRGPALWRLDGPTVDDVTARVRDTLSARGIPVDTVRVRQVVVDQEDPGLQSLGLQLEGADSSAVARALSALRPEDGTTTEGHPLHLPDVHAVEVQGLYPDGISTLRVTPATSWEPEAAGTADRSVERTPELHRLYSLDGFFQDTNHDFVPDDVAGTVSYAGPAAAEPLAALSMRLGLETAGARWPLIRPAGSTDEPEKHGLPLLVGVDHPALDRLRTEDRLPGAAPGPGEGALRVVEEGPGEKPALVMNGGDRDGLASIADYTARRLPYLGGHGKGKYRLQRIDTEVRRFVQGKSGAGQVAAGLEKLDTWLQRLEGTSLDSLHVTLAADSIPEGLNEYVRQHVQTAAPDAEVAVETPPTGYGVGAPVLDEEFDIPWEGDTFWKLFREKVLPEVEPGDTGRIELRLSEGPDVRARLTRQIHAALDERGVDTTEVDVSVLSAYKQGFRWLVDEVVPAVKGRDDIEEVNIKYHTLQESDEVKWQLIHANTRWLQELYPVDAVLSRELGIADSLVSFEPTWDSDPIYSVEVLGSNGDTLHTDSFTPRYAVRPYFDHFPKHDSVRVPTGGLRATIGGETLVDRRIKTDLERFWDHFQAETIPKIVEYVMDLQEGDPRPEDAPFFDKLRMHVQLSEPNYRLGIQEHVVSATEALHEDLYFHMLSLFTLLGNRYNVAPLDYPGRILPYIQPPAPGEAGHARIEMTGKEHTRPELRLAHVPEGEEQVVRRYSLPNIENVPAPELRGLRTRAGQKGLAGLRFDVETETDTSVYEEYRQRAPEAEIDRAYPSNERLEGMARHLKNLQAQGMFEGVLSYDRVEEVQLRFATDDTASVSRTVTLPQTDHPQETDPPTLPTGGPSVDTEPIVQWETPIPPLEANQLMGTLGTFPEIHPYYMETSFLGHDIFAMDLRPPQGGQYISQAKLNAQKPTLYLNAREDGNEVSSTSYVLRLAEKVATEPATRAYLDSVNVVIHPMSNPDGAQIAYEMQKTNPDFMLHAGYYAALGPSMEDQEDEQDPLYSEATVEPRLRKTWLPDIFMNLHGYPSHEWVQYFSGYSAWVFSRNGTARSWWPTRGYFLTGFDWIDDPDHPELETAAFTALDTLTSALSERDTLMALSQEEYRRYHKYRKFETDFGEYFRNGVRVHSDIKGDKLDSEHPSDVRDPRITPFSITTEAQDETAQGDWLKLQARAGLTAVTAALRYLYEGENRVVREARVEDGTVRRWIYREKPVLPPGSEDAESSGK